MTDNGARVGGAGESLVVIRTDGKKDAFPIREIDQLVLHGNAQVTTQAIHLCVHREVGIHWVTNGGRYVTAVAPGAGPVQRRIRQYEALRDPGLSFRLAKRLALARSEGQLRFLLRASRGADRTSSGVQAAADGIRAALAGMDRAEGIDSLRGHEGEAGRCYFSAIPALLRDDLDARLRFSGRNRRPPKDCFNALLSFGYALLYRDVVQAILAVGLDLMELFRVPLWDMSLVASVNRLQWDPGAHFTFAGLQVWLSDAGRKQAIEVYERRKEDHWKHPVTHYSLSYGRLIELEVRLLEKEWTGEPGLFAQMRLR